MLLGAYVTWTAGRLDRLHARVDAAWVAGRVVPGISGGGSGSAAPKPGAEGGEAKAGTLREFKENAERMFLVGKLRENGWNISKTAEVIGTPRSNLYKKLEQYQISQESGTDRAGGSRPACVSARPA